MTFDIIRIVLQIIYDMEFPKNEYKQFLFGWLRFSTKFGYLGLEFDFPPKYSDFNCKCSWHYIHASPSLNRVHTNSLLFYVHFELFAPLNWIPFLLACILYRNRLWRRIYRFQTRILHEKWIFNCTSPNTHQKQQQQKNNVLTHFMQIMWHWTLIYK